MSKLSFRARALDTTKPMPVLRTEDVPDLPDFAAINRAVPQMPTGMEKEEESEHHLQRAISAQQAFGRAVDHVIPTPEVFPVNDKHYDEFYPPTFKIPRQLIHVQLPSFEQDHPEYDMDSEDEEWLSQMKPYLNITETKFEEMIECLEKSSGVQKVINLTEANSLLKGDESVMISIYDYWLNKKLKVGKSLIPVVKTEKRDGTSGNNPYIAFRRRTEKMQTRKNRKNDESSYEKMLKLKRDFSAVRDIMMMIKEREVLKYDILKYDVDIYEKRYKLSDFNGQIYNEIALVSRLAKDQALAANQSREKPPKTSKNDENAPNRRKRDYKKRSKHEAVLPQKTVQESGEYFSSEDENTNEVIYHSSQLNESEESDNPDGQFAFKRKKGCNYHAPLDRLSSWPWESSEEGGLGDRRFRFSLASLSRPPNHCMGFARRRIGRGGRLVFDRVKSSFDDYLTDLSSDISESRHIDIEYNDDNNWISSKPISPQDQNCFEKSVNFNTENFQNEADFPNNPIFINFNEENLLENKLYKYNESELSAFIETRKNKETSVVCNSQHSVDGNTSKSSVCSNIFNKLKTIKSSSQFVHSIDTDVCNSILDAIDDNSSMTTDNLISEIKIDSNDFDFSDTSFPVLLSDDNAIDDMIIDQIDHISLLNSNICDRIQTSKLDNVTSKSPNIINNGSDFFNSSDNALPCEPSTTVSVSQSPSTSAVNATDSKANVSSQNSTIITSSSFSSHCKLNLSNSQKNSNLHPTDVT